MLVADTKALLDLQAAIVAATHSITDERGGRVILSTINDRQLRSAALVAMQVALGEVVWPGDQKITAPKPQRAPGIFADE